MLALALALTGCEPHVDDPHIGTDAAPADCEAPPPCASAEWEQRCPADFCTFTTVDRATGRARVCAVPRGEPSCP